MSKRLQVIVGDGEYRAVARVAKRRKLPIAEIVREGMRRIVEEDERAEDPEARIARLQELARRYNGPTGDIEQLLAEIELGRAGKHVR